MPRILIVEDEPKLLRNLREGLTEEGFDVLTAADGDSGLHRASTESVDLLLLDLMLPGRSGLDVLRELRRCGSGLPILVLTAKDQIADRVQGLDDGADDYLVKPFAFDELLARIRAILRRSSADEPWVLRAADVALNLRTREVTRGETELLLSKREYELLEYLLQHNGEVLSRESIARDVWKDSSPVETNVIDVYVNYLRKKIDSENRPKLIHSVRGIGYCLKVEP